MKFTKVKSLDKYTDLIGQNKYTIVAIWETGSHLERLHDEFSDRDFAFIWGKSIPTAEERTIAAHDLNFEIHEIKDVPQIGMSFDMFSDGEFLFNIGHGTSEKESKWHEALFGDKLPGDLEEILMSISALEGGKMHYQKDNWVDKLLEKIKLTPKIRERLIKHYSIQISRDLKLLHKSSSRKDLLQFTKYLYKVLRNLQLIYLLKHDKPIVSEKFFKHRFAKIENGQITKLISKISSQLEMIEIYNDVKNIASDLNVKQSEKLSA